MDQELQDFLGLRLLWRIHQYLVEHWIKGGLQPEDKEAEDIVAALCRALNTNIMTPEAQKWADEFYSPGPGKTTRQQTETYLAQKEKHNADSK